MFQAIVEKPALTLEVQGTTTLHYTTLQTFASGAEVPLAARVRASVGAEVGVTLTILQTIPFIALSFLETHCTVQ